MNFDYERALSLLVCPQTKASLVYDGRTLVSTDPETRLRYTIRDAIPIMLAEEAEAVPPDEWSELMRQQGRDPVSGQVLAGTAE